MAEASSPTEPDRREWWIDADGLFVNAVEWPAPAGSAEATPVLLVHGLGGSITNWLAVGAELAATLQTRVLAIDLAGFGRTRPDGRPASLGTNGRLLEAVARDRGPFILVGNSMGGALSVGLAARHPELVARLVLVDPAVPRPHGGRRNVVRAVRYAATSIPRLGGPFMAGRARALGPDRLVDATVRIVMHRPERLDPRIRAEMVAQSYERARWPESSAAYVEAAGSLFRYLAQPMRDDIAAVTAPTLIIHGRQDRLVPLSLVQALARERSDWALEIFDDCGHVPMLEHPDRFVATIAGWLSSASAVLADAPAD